MENTFKESEIKERKNILKLAEKHNPIYIKEISAVGSYCAYDAAIISGATYCKILLEVKMRNIPSTKYNTGIIEEEKVNRIIAIKERLKKEKEIDVKIIYMAVYTDGVAILFDAMDIMYVNEMLAPKNTASDGNNEMVMKRFNNYEITKGEKIQLW